MATTGSHRDDTAAAIDVVMPVHDGARHLVQALDSLRGQTMRDFRVFVVDDASTDATPGLLAEWAQADSRIEVIRRETPGGVAAALNAGLSHCTAPLVARMDADDICEPRRFEVQLSRMQADPELGVLSCGYVRIEEDGTRRDAITPMTGHDRLRFHCMFMNGFLHPGVVFRRAAVTAAGGYDERFWTAQDSDLWDRLMLRGVRFDNVPQPLMRYRVHQNSVTKARGTTGRALSLSVPQRALSRYLGRDLDLEETRCAVDLFQGFETLGREETARGVQILWAVRQAAETERRDIKEAFDRRIGRQLLKQARRAGRRRPLAAAAAVGEGARWRLGLAPGHDDVEAAA